MGVLQFEALEASRPEGAVDGSETLKGGAEAAPSSRAVPPPRPPGAPPPRPPGAPPPRPRAVAVAPDPAPRKELPGKVIKPTEFTSPLTPELIEFDHDALLRRKRNNFFIRMLLLVLLPTIASALYVYVYATPRYVSTFQIVYKDTVSASSGSNALSALMGSAGGTDMTQVISSYITSEDMANIVDKKLDLRREYSDPKIDWLDRMPAQASREKFLATFRSHISVRVNSGGYLTVEVEAFEPKRAQAIAEAISDAADAMVSAINSRPSRDLVDFTNKERSRFEATFASATAALTAFREKHSAYDFGNNVTNLSTVVGGLQAQLADARTKLAQTRSLVSDSAPSVRYLRSQIAALKKQIDAEQTKFSSSSGSDSAVKPSQGQGAQPENYSKIMAQYNLLTIKQGLAEKDYAAASQAYEAAVLELAKKTAYVVTFVQPNRPQHAERPDGFYTIMTTLIGALILYYIGSLAVGVLRDQIGYH